MRRMGLRRRIAAAVAASAIPLAAPLGPSPVANAAEAPGAPTVVAQQTTEKSEGHVEKRAELSDGSSITYGWKEGEPSDVGAQSAFGCNELVCQSIEGRGVYVDRWSTTAIGNVGCSYATYYDNDQLLRQTDDICPDTPAEGSTTRDGTSPPTGRSRTAPSCATRGS